MKRERGHCQAIGIASMAWPLFTRSGERRSQGCLRGLTCAALIAISSGCKTHSPSQIVSPKVIGRVVDARTLQPIEGVKVRREDSSQKPGPGEAQKGGQAIAQPPLVRTKEDGTFSLDCVRDLAIFRSVGWFVV